MVKLQKWEKEELLRIYKRNRADKRCNIQRKLYKEVKELTQTFDDEIKELQKQRISILRLHHLAGLNNTSYGCPTERQHPDLIKFDKETDNQISKIIRGES